MTDLTCPPELLKALASSTVSRRHFITTLAGASFALAVQPVAAETLITTPVTGLTAGTIEIPVVDGLLPAYRAAPSGKGPFPVILVVQEIFGVHEHIQDICRRLAQHGYLAIAPELYARQGDVSHLSNIDEIRKVVAKVPDAQVFADLDAAAAWAGSQGGDIERLGITGFCWGGRITWLYAAQQAKVKAAVAWYGKLSGEPNSLTPRHPFDIAAHLKTPVLGLYGGQDVGIPLPDVQHTQQLLADGHSPAQIHVYPDAPHAFYADYRPSYRKQPAEDGWQRLLDWFQHHGVN